MTHSPFAPGDSDQLLNIIFAFGIVSCCLAFLLILLNSFWGEGQTRRRLLAWAASIQSRQEKDEGSQVKTKNRLVREIALETRCCRRLSTFWHAAFASVMLCQLSVTGGTTLSAWKQYAPSGILAGVGVLGVLATIGNGFFKPRLLAERYLLRAQYLANTRRTAEADWDAVPAGASDASERRRSIIEKLVRALGESSDEHLSNPNGQSYSSRVRGRFRSSVQNGGLPS